MSTPVISPLHRLVLQFNFLPSMELHPDRRAEFATAPVWARVAASAGGHRHLSALILQRLGLEDDWVTAFETRERRIALLGWQALERLVLHAGVALNALWVATRIGRGEVAAIKAGLGPDLYAFALGRGRFLGTGDGWPEPPMGADPVAWFRRAGLRFVDGCAQQQPPGLKRRLALRLPAGPAGADALPLPEPEQASALFRKLAPEVGEPCVSLLA